MVDNIRVLRNRINKLQQLENSLSRFNTINIENTSNGFVNIGNIFNCTESRTPRFSDQVDDLIEQVKACEEISNEQFGNLLIYTVFLENTENAVKIVKAATPLIDKTIKLVDVPEWVGWSIFFEKVVMNYLEKNPK